MKPSANIFRWIRSKEFVVHFYCLLNLVLATLIEWFGTRKLCESVASFLSNKKEHRLAKELSVQIRLAIVVILLCVPLKVFDTLSGLQVNDNIVRQDICFTFLKSLPFKSVWTSHSASRSSFSKLRIEQQGVEFGEMTSQQESQLDLFLQKYTIRWILSQHPASIIIIRIIR